MKEVPSAVVHFYRAIVMHGDVWRERLDATTNWAVVTTVGVISFAFTRPGAPHFILLLLIFACGLFLFMESRRYQMYDLWRRRFRTLNQYLIAPYLAPELAEDQAEIDAQLANLARDLGRAVPHLQFIDAMGYRLRRNYGYIFTFVIGCWVLKLFLHPVGADSPALFLERAAIGAIPGTAVIGAALAFMILITFLALRAPSEQMLSWQQLPSPLGRLANRTLFTGNVLFTDQTTTAKGSWEAPPTIPNVTPPAAEPDATDKNAPQSAEIAAPAPADGEEKHGGEGNKAKAPGNAPDKTASSQTDADDGVAPETSAAPDPSPAEKLEDKK